jgi:signal transduction histidine kinase
MIQVISISLENEMDLVLAHKKSLKIAEKLGLTLATQTTFATAVSEIARTVIEHTNNGQLQLGVEQNKQRYTMVASVEFDSDIKFTQADEGIYYAQKLVPEFNFLENKGKNLIEMKIGLPRSLKLDKFKIDSLKQYFLTEPPTNAYEEIKLRNINLNIVAGAQEEEIRRSKIIDEKKNEFISMASHEIKTPITIIKAYAQMAKASKDQCSDKVREMLEKIDYQSAKLLSLVQQLLDVSKIENGNLVYSMATVELSAFVTDMVSVMKHLTPRHQIITSFPECVYVTMDKLRMEQVFSNLLSNAAKYSKENTPIKIECVLEREFVKVAVTDEGIGLSAKNIRSVFDKFYRAEDVLRTHAGLGMGLFIASKIVTDHGGKIWVESIEGAGSTFFFTIPAVQAEVEDLVTLPVS